MTSVAAAYGVNVRSVCRWLANFANGGQTVLLDKPISGLPFTVSSDDLHWLARAVRDNRDNTPSQFKFAFGVCTLSPIAALIEREFCKTLSMALVSRIMKDLGFSAQKPLYQAWQQDAKLVWRWETETYPVMRAEAQALGAEIHVVDESGILSNYQTVST